MFFTLGQFFPGSDSWRRRAVSLLVFAILVWGVGLFGTNPVLGMDVSEEGPRVLLLNSYHAQYPWTDDVVRGIKQGLRDKVAEERLHVEFMDLRRHTDDPDYEQMLHDLYFHKFRHYRFDLIISSDDYALNFLEKYRATLFPGTPLVFCGVNAYDADLQQRFDNVTGIFEAMEVEKNLELIYRLHPDVKRVVFLLDRTSLGSAMRREVEKAIAVPSREGVRLEIWDNYTLPDLYRRLETLEAGTVVQLVAILADRAGTNFSYTRHVPLLARHSRVPVYGMWGMALGHGIVGGMLTNGELHGRRTAKMALQVLAGESPEAIPPIVKGVYKPGFDYAQLRRFAIPLDHLPAGSMIINRNLPIYEIPQKALFQGLILLAGLALVGLFLLKNVYSRYRAEKALRESEARFRGYFDLNLVGMVTRSVDSKWLEVNDKFCDMVKYSREELQGKSWVDLTHPDDLAETFDKFEAFSAGEIDLDTQDKRYVCKDGTVIHVKLSTRALRHPDGRIDRLVSVVQNITNRKTVEAALRLDEARLEALEALNQMGESSVEEIVNFIVASAISLTRSKIGYLAFVNEGQGTLVKHGWTRGVIQECKMEKKSAGFPIEKAGLWAEVVRHKKPIIINDYAYPQLVKKGIPEGHTSIERFMGVPLMDQDKVVAIIGVGNKTEKYEDADVRQLSLLGQGLVRLMEAKRTEQGLRESQQEYKRLYQQFQTLLDGIPDAIFLLTPARHIVWGNAGAARHLGLDVRSLPGEYCCRLWAGRTEACSECPVVRCFESGKPEEETLTFPEGRIWGVKAFPLTNAVGEVENVIKMAVDITEKVKLRDEAERSARLASLGELAAGVAHEINNPNGVLMLNSNFLADFFEEALPFLPDFMQEQGIEDLAGLDASEMKAEIPQMLVDMQGSSKRISRIVKDLKQFVQSEAETFFGPVDLNEIVEIALRLTGNTLKKFAASYEVCNAPDLPRVKGILQQLEQVVINLIVNACQAIGDKNGRVFVATYFDETHRQSVVEVRDEGQGIDPEVLHHITEPFFTTKRQDGGTGLGLSVSARIVKEHHGKLEFFSLPGKGTTVRLTLPSVVEGEMQ